MSRFDSSTKLPPRPNTDIDAATKPVDVNEFTATLTAPQVCPFPTHPSTNAVLRESYTLLTPMLRNMARFRALPAVATTTMPMPCATCTDARPTPPAAPCTNITSPALAPAARSAISTVTNTVGIVAACLKDAPGGKGAKRGLVRNYMAAQAPGRQPKHGLPLHKPPRSLAHRHHNSGHVRSREARVARVHAQHIENVAEVDAYRLDPQAHLAGAEVPDIDPLLP
eukprot:jgi/Tetstr1/425115/TSEL_015577.t1